MGCRPEPSSVSPLDIPWRLRTAFRPFRSLIDSAPYRSAPLFFLARSGSWRSSRRPLSWLILTGPFRGIFCRRAEYTKPAAIAREKRPRDGGKTYYISVGYKGIRGGEQASAEGRDPTLLYAQ